MKNVTDSLKDSMAELKAKAEQTEDPEEKERLRNEISRIGGTLLELENPHPRKNGYDGISPHWYGPSKRKITKPAKRRK